MTEPVDENLAGEGGTIDEYGARHFLHPDRHRVHHLHKIRKRGHHPGKGGHRGRHPHGPGRHHRAHPPHHGKHHPPGGAHHPHGTPHHTTHKHHGHVPNPLEHAINPLVSHRRVVGHHRKAHPLILVMLGLDPTLDQYGHRRPKHNRHRVRHVVRGPKTGGKHHPGQGRPHTGRDQMRQLEENLHFFGVNSPGPHIPPPPAPHIAHFKTPFHG